MSTCFQKTPLQAVLLMGSLTLLACEPERVKFEFRPTEGSVFLDRLEETIQQETVGLGDDVLRRTTETRTRIERPDAWKWVFLTTPTKVEELRNGKRFDESHPITAAVLNGTFAIEVWDDGRVNSVSGYEELIQRIRRALSEEAAGMFDSVLNRRIAEETAIAEWNASRASLVGRELAVGDSLEIEADLPLPTGGLLPYTQEVTFEGWEECGDRRCARLQVVSWGGGPVESEETQRLLTGSFVFAVCGMRRRTFERSPSRGTVIA